MLNNFVILTYQWGVGLYLLHTSHFSLLTSQRL